MIRTTIKIREDLLRKAKETSFKEDIPLYKVFNDAVNLGFRAKLNSQERKDLFKAINRFKKHAIKHGAPTAEEIYRLSKLDQK